MSNAHTSRHLVSVAESFGISHSGRTDLWLERLRDDNEAISLLREVELSSFDKPIDLAALVQEKHIEPGPVIDIPDRTHHSESVVAHVQACLEKIGEAEHLNAFTTVFSERALEDAGRLDRLIAAGIDPGPLAGKVVGVKDLIEVEGHATTAGTRAYNSSPAFEDSSVVARLRSAGAVVVGTTNLHALAYGAMNTSSDWGPVRNPLRPEAISGGSSGGSAAAVACGLVDIALGTDTGGSIRIPASLCGVVGLKPTYGRVSTRGVHPLAVTLDHVGPITRNVADAVLAQRVLAPSPGPWSQIVPTRLDGIRVGIPDSFFLDYLDDEVRQALDSAVTSIENLGGSVRQVALPTARYSPAAMLATIGPEALDLHLALLSEHADGLPVDVRLRLEAAMFRTGADYARAQRVRAKLQNEMGHTLQSVDVLLTPTLPITAPRPASVSIDVQGVRLPVQQALTRLTAPFNLTGYPALSFPWRADKQGGSIGMQLAGKPMEEEKILGIAAALEPLSEHSRKTMLAED